jgi:plastocyanin
MTRTLRWSIPLLGLVLMAACSSSSSSGSSSAASTPGGAVATTPAASPSGGGEGGQIQIGNDLANDHGTATITGQSSVNVEQHNTSQYYFDPTVLAGSAGQKITVHVENKGTLPHTFTIDAQQIDVTLQPGDEQDVQVTLPQSGAVEFYCSFHHGQGMAGELTLA